MCEALPGPRCSNHAAKRMIANRMKRDKSRQKIQELNSQINKAYSDCDINRATALLEKMTEEEEKCQDLESKNIEFTQVWYTTEKGIEYLDQKIEDAEDPKTKSTIKQTRDKALETKEKQRYSKKLYDMASSTPEQIAEKRRAYIKQTQDEYVKSYKEGKNVDKAERRFKIAKDRFLLAQAGDYDSVGVTPMNVGHAFNDSMSDKKCYVRVPQNYLVDDHMKYFQYGSPLDRVSSINRDGDGLSVTTETGQKLRVGEVWVPFSLDK